MYYIHHPQNLCILQQEPPAQKLQQHNHRIPTSGVWGEWWVYTYLVKEQKLFPMDTWLKNNHKIKSWIQWSSNWSCNDLIILHISSYSSYWCHIFLFDRLEISSSIPLIDKSVSFLIHLSHGSIIRYPSIQDLLSRNYFISNCFIKVNTFVGLLAPKKHPWRVV